MRADGTHERPRPTRGDVMGIEQDAESYVDGAVETMNARDWEDARDQQGGGVDARVGFVLSLYA
jgi:hypothetical protein